MPYITIPDGTRLFYKDWGAGRPVVLSHGWPANADAWDAQMLLLVQSGFRVIAHDRRGHGRSDQPASGNDIDTYADDLATLISTLDLQNATLVGHSIGGGEIVRYISRHGSARVAKAVLIAAPVPLMARTETHPDGVPLEIFDGIRNALAGDRSQFFRELAVPFYGLNRPQAVPSQSLIDAFWAQGMTGGILAQYACVREFSEVDFTDDLKRLRIPTLLLHGDDDQNVPVEMSSRPAASLIPNATLKVYAGGSHGLIATHASQVNEDLLAFINA
ncbi:alpha/beta fold hydrolase [Cupriavidus taiwanensis]|uniref:alpha/beta fold hydrolase n=1 Tax=Cupriavidus taiwanensis TaxID=164546 RepID=UPI000E10CA18|nr:alpha/beta hydrolase [Cupriavidus taiwanensis]SOY48225.1 Non-heme chloroperoxidase [Cupriavidus taiwanensis]SOY48238.1 Non-heme chloroperoxidase [Cupriavidus taiwanensis]SOY82752.1 Non-heme chloroperoxidase [Cupriavidus taiwanensis]SOZ55365.1 Non-heme chloroperoxidase [Cupriavidus taiwanensis]SOZ78606.1 Non-heme chloroperoxidase [Cupriavidus taiwanensis]